MDRPTTIESNIRGRQSAPYLTLRTLAVVVALATAGPALSQSVAMPPHPDINTTGFSGDASALSGAVTAVETGSGGRVVEIRYNNVSGAPGYDVVLERKGEVSFQRFSQQTPGLVAMTDKTEPAWMLGWRGRRDVSLVSKAKVPLTDAIRTAEAATGAPAVAAGIATSASNGTSDVHAYNVAVFQNGSLQRVAVDSATGQPISDPSALAAW